MTLPPWPADPPAFGQVRLRVVDEGDAAMACELSTDPYVPKTGSLPGNATMQEAAAWVVRQQGRRAEGAGFSFTIARRSDDVAIGHCGLWLKELDEGRASAGYAIIPSKRGQGYGVDALMALTAFAWTVPGLSRVELFIEPCNTASRRMAERVGYREEEVLVGHRLIGGEHRDMILCALARVDTGGDDSGV